MQPNNKFLPTLIIIAVMSGAIIFLFQQNHKLKSELNARVFEKQHQDMVIDSLRKTDLAGIITNVLDKVEEELNSNASRKLSDERIESIVSLCYYIKPYPVVVSESINENLSPERGLILLMLLQMKMDSGSWRTILTKADFSGADLRKADLKNSDLIGAKLPGANLQHAHLQQSNLSNADLAYANLVGANLSYAMLHGTNFRRATMQYANFDNADLNKANLNGANIDAAQMRNTDWHGASMIWSQAKGTLLNYANLEGVDLIGTNFTMANLNSAILCNVNLIRGNLTEANLLNSDLTGTELKFVRVSEKDWLSFLKNWEVSGTEKILKTYTIMPDPSDARSPYRLEKLAEIKSMSKN